MITVDIHSGDFQACINLDCIETLQLSKIRKIFKLMKRPPAWDDALKNQLAEEQTADFLKTAVTDSEAAWKRASSDYTRLWSSDMDRATKTANRMLLEALHKTKARYARFVRIQEIFNET